MFVSRPPRLCSRPRVLATLAAALCLAVVPSVGLRSAPARAGSSDKVTLVFYNQWIGVQEKYLQEIIRRFEKLHPNIVIKESVVADTTKIIAAMQGGKPPDIVDFGLGQFLPEMASKGALTNLDPYIKAAHLNLGIFVPKALQVDTYNGHLYGMPFMDFNHALIYNTELFKKAGIARPPATLEELEADAYRLTRQDRDGKITQMGFIPDWPGGTNGQVVNLVDYGWLFGGDWYNSRTGQVTADLSQNIKALDWETHFYTRYGAKNIDNFVKSAGAYLSNDVFASGKLAMAYDGEWWLDFAPPSFEPKIGVVPFPAPRGLSRYTGTSFLDNDPQVIPSGSQHKQEAYEFLTVSVRRSRRDALHGTAGVQPVAAQGYPGLGDQQGSALQGVRGHRQRPQCPRLPASWLRRRDGHRHTERGGRGAARPGHAGGRVAYAAGYPAESGWRPVARWDRGW